ISFRVLSRRAGWASAGLRPSFRQSPMQFLRPLASGCGRCPSSPHNILEDILMSASTTSSMSVYTTSVFWERLWRSSGIQSFGLFVVSSVIYGYQPQIGASPDALVAFYDGNRTRTLIAAVLSGMAILNLMWFAAALRVPLADAGQDGWGAAATAS